MCQAAPFFPGGFRGRSPRAGRRRARNDAALGRFTQYASRPVGPPALGGVWHDTAPGGGSGAGDAVGMRRAQRRAAAALGALVLAAVGATSAAALDALLLDPAGEPAGGVTLAAIEGDAAGVSGPDGRVRWTVAPAGGERLIATGPNGELYGVIVVPSPVAGDPVVLRLPHGPTETVRVAVDRIDPTYEAPPANGTTRILADDVAAGQPERLVDALEQVPGTDAIGAGPAAVPALRGLARGRTLILLDGARLSTERRAGPSATFLDPFILEEVEVLRGPGSVVHGSDAIGGVIDLRTVRPERGQPLGGKLRASAGVGEPRHGGALQLTAGSRTGAVLLNLRGRTLDDYRSPAGRIPESGGEDRGVLFRIEHDLGPGVASLTLQSDRALDVGKPEPRDDRAITYPTEEADRLNASFRMPGPGALDELGLGLFVGRYRLVLRKDTFADGAAPREVLDTDVEAADYGLRAFGTVRRGARDLRFGLDANGRFDLEAFETTTVFDEGGPPSTERSLSIEDARRSDAGLYATGESPLGERWRGTAGLRFDRVSARNEGGALGSHRADESALSGHAALTFAASERLALTLQLARGFRDPTLSDRYFVGQSGRGIVFGNPALEPETSRQLDLSLRRSGPRIELATYAYHYRIDDLIERFEAQPDEFFFRNRGRARVDGAEIELTARLGTAWGLTAGAWAIDGEALDDGEPLAEIPPARVALGARRRLAAGRGWVELRGLASARDDEPGPGERVIAGWARVDVGLGWQLGERMHLHGAIGNLLDADYLASADELAVTEPGRSVLLEATAAF